MLLKTFLDDKFDYLFLWFKERRLTFYFICVWKPYFTKGFFLTPSKLREKAIIFYIHGSHILKSFNPVFCVLLG